MSATTTTTVAQSYDERKYDDMSISQMSYQNKFEERQEFYQEELPSPGNAVDIEEEDQIVETKMSAGTEVLKSIMKETLADEE